MQRQLYSFLYYLVSNGLWLFLLTSIFELYLNLLKNCIPYIHSIILYNTMKGNSTPIHPHLHHLYPNLPKYANDPQQSPVIQTYSLLLKRYQGIYGHEPQYFIRSPISMPVFGGLSPCVGLAVGSVCGERGVIVCVGANGYQKIRVNNYQSAVYGEKVMQGDCGKWKYEEAGDQYGSAIVASFKMYAQMANIHTLPGLDILIYEDFVHDEHVNGKEALCLGLATALSMVTGSKNGLTEQFCTKYLSKMGNLLSSTKPNNFPLLAQYNHLTISSSKMVTQSFSQQQAQPPKHIPFPNDLQLVLAHSMTPLPKKMTSGKRENLRACEVAIGIEIIKNQLGAVNDIASLGQLQKYLNSSTKELLEAVEEYLPKQELSVQRIQQITQKSLIQILKPIPFANNVIDQNLTFKPYNRIKYYLLQQLAIQNLTPENFLPFLVSSSANAKSLLEIGSQQFDDMLSVVSGLVLATKIVGDGWGGYLLLVCEKGKGEEVVGKLVKEYYLGERNRVLLSDDVEMYVGVLGKPAGGLGVLDPSSEIWFC